MEKIIPNEKFNTMNDLSLAVTCAAGEPCHYYTNSLKQIKQVDANKFIEKYLKVEKYKYYKIDDRVKLKHLHITKDAIILISGVYLYIKGDTYYSFDDIDTNERVVSIWFLSADDAKLY